MRLRRAWRLLGALVTCAMAASVLLILPLRWLDPPTSSYILRDDSERVLHFWVDLEQISPQVAVAVLATEDQRFVAHHGFDFASIRDALESGRRGRRLRGASTITQQVARNLYLWPGRSLVRKAIEAWLTLLIEASWPKRRILEVYLNIVEFAPGIYGAAAASYHYFNRLPERLTADQAALMAAALPSPARRSLGSPSVSLQERQAQVLREMERIGGRAVLDGLWDG